MVINYNLTNLTSSETISDVVKVANEFTEGVLLLAFVIGLFFVMVMVLMRRTGFVDALAVSGFVCFLISAMLSYAGLFSLFAVLFFLAITAFATIMIYIRKT